MTGCVTPPLGSQAPAQTAVRQTTTPDWSRLTWEADGFWRRPRGGVAAAEEFGGVDGLFTNAGTGASGWVHETALADWESVLRVNLTGNHRGDHAAGDVPHNDDGLIVSKAGQKSALIGRSGRVQCSHQTSGSPRSAPAPRRRH